MHIKFKLFQLTTIIIYIILFNTKSVTCKSNHDATSKNRHHHHHSHHHEHQSADAYLKELSANDSKVERNDIYYQGSEIGSYYNHHHHDSDTHMKELAESAKDPKNLLNGIFHNGAITYDLGLPHYEILNPLDPPEIITSDHPEYHEHLNHIQKTNNFTIEDFGVTPMPPCDSTTDAAVTTTAVPEITTTEVILTTIAKEYEIVRNNIEKEISQNKEKIQKLNEELRIKDEAYKLYASQAKDTEVKFVLIRRNNNLRKKLRPAPFRKPKLQTQPQYQSSVNSTDEKICNNQPKTTTNQNYLSNESSYVKRSDIHKESLPQANAYVESQIKTANYPYTYEIRNNLPAQNFYYYQNPLSLYPLPLPVSHKYLGPSSENVRNPFAREKLYTRYNQIPSTYSAVLNNRGTSLRQQSVMPYRIVGNLNHLYHSPPHSK